MPRHRTFRCWSISGPHGAGRAGRWHPSSAGQLEPQIRLGKLDTEAEPELAARFAIRTIPSLVMLRKGRELARTGPMPLASLMQWARQIAR